jgi:hypothetical protein
MILREVHEQLMTMHKQFVHPKDTYFLEMAECVKRTIDWLADDERDAVIDDLVAKVDRLERENRNRQPRSVEDTDIADDPDYQAFVQEQAKHCRCSHGPCDGVLAGGPCDEICDEEEYDENFPDDEEEDIEGYAT